MSIKRFWGKKENYIYVMYWLLLLRDVQCKAPSSHFRNCTDWSLELCFYVFLLNDGLSWDAWLMLEACKKPDKLTRSKWWKMHVDFQHFHPPHPSPEPHSFWAMQMRRIPALLKALGQVPEILLQRLQEAPALLKWNKKNLRQS